MADRMAAEIWIGGPIPEALVDEFCGVLRTESLSLDYGDAWFEPQSAEELLEAAAENDGLLRLCCEDAPMGEIQDLEHWLQSNDIPYTRKSDGKYEHDPEIVEYRPEEGLYVTAANKALQPVVPVPSLEPIRCQLEAAAKLLRQAAKAREEDRVMPRDVLASGDRLVNGPVDRLGGAAVEQALEKLSRELPPKLPPLPPFRIVVDIPEAAGEPLGEAGRLPYPLDKAAKAHPNGERWLVSANQGPIAVVIRVDAEEGLREAYADAIVEAVNARVEPPKICDDLMRVLLPILPNATLGEDNDGQVLIHTDLALEGDNLVPLN